MVSGFPGREAACPTFRSCQEAEMGSPFTMARYWEPRDGIPAPGPMRDGIPYLQQRETWSFRKYISMFTVYAVVPHCVIVVV